MRLRSCRGFSLVEILVATAITVVVMALVMGVLVSTNSYWAFGNVQMNISEEAQRGMVAMLSDLRLTDPSMVSIASTSATQPNDILTYNLPTIINGDVQLDSKGRPVYPTITSFRFRVVNGPIGGQLVREQINAGGQPIQTTVLANRIQGITFTGAVRNLAPPPATLPATNNPEAVTIAMATQQDVRPAGGSRLMTTEATAQVQFRNEVYRPAFSSVGGAVQNNGNTLQQANLDPKSLPNI